MARLVFPDQGTRSTDYLDSSGYKKGVRNGTVLVYTDAAATILADIRNADGTATAAPGTLSTDAYSQIPLFQGPNDGTDMLYVVVAGGPVTPIYAVINTRVDAATAAVAAETAARAAGDATTAAAAAVDASAKVATEVATARAAESANAAAIALRTPLLTPTATKTASYTAAVGDLALMNVAGGGTALTLPTAPADKAQVGYRAIGATTAVPLVITAGGSDTIGTGGATSASIPLADEVAVLQYQASASRWLGVANVKTQASLDGRYDAAGVAAAAQAAAIAAAATDATSKVATETTRATGAESTLTTTVTGNTTAIGLRLIAVDHGATAGTARPTSSLPVKWFGTVVPTNAIDNDEWYDRTTELLKRRVSGVFVAAGSASYATLNQGDTARRVAARPPAPVPLSALTPTVTLSAAGAGTSISGGVLKAPKRLTYTGADLARADMANDPHYAHFGVPNDCAQYGTSFPDYVYIAGDYLTGTPNSQVAPWQSRKGFTHTGQVFEFLFKALTTGHLYRITVNGQRLAEDFTSVTTSAGQTYRLIVDFGSSATREVIFEHDNLNFGGFQIEPAATLQRLSRRRVRIACIGDSLTGGAGPLSRLASSPEVAAAMLGCDHFYNLGVGGTGVLNTGGTGGATAATRIASDLTKAGVDPDIVLYWNGFNDAASSAAAVQTQAALDLAAIIAAKPKAIVIAVGCWTPGNPTASYINVNNAIKAAAVTAGALFIDLIDPTGLLATVPTYASGNTYRVGDYVIQNGYLWICQTATGVAGAFDSTKFRSVGVITGTGKVGTTTGDGNADVAIHTDGIHPTVIGSKIVGAFLAKRIYDLCRSMVTPA